MTVGDDHKEFVIRTPADARAYVAGLHAARVAK